MRLSFHHHTAYSHDCALSLAHLEKLCVKKGIDVIAITDHHIIAGAVKAAATFTKVKVIIGQEIETAEGEVIGLFLTQEITRGLGVAETLSAIHEQGGVAVVPHPFDRLRHHVLTHEALEKHLEEIDFIEVFNARAVFSADNTAAQQFAQTHGKPGIVGADAHTFFEVGGVGIDLPDCSDAQSFCAAMQSAQFTTRKASIFAHVATKIVRAVKQVIPHYGT